MRTALLPLAIVVLALIPFGCKDSSQPVGTSNEPQVPDFDTSAFPDAIRLTNGTVSLIVIPSIGGRIMRYGFVGEPNALWNNPGVTALPTTRPNYFNYGGDKAWPWPQDDWMLLIGRNFPPPPECDQVTFKSRLIGSHGVRLESPPIPSHAARIVREITLDPMGTRVTIVTRLEQATGDRPPPSMAAWSVTQVPGDRQIYARMIPDGVFESMRPEMPTPTTRPIDAKNPRVIALEKTTPSASKTGLDADILAAVAGDTLFVLRSSTAAKRTEKFRPAERGQLFIQQADPPKQDVPRYVELEFTSPREDLASGKAAELSVTWELRKDEKGWKDKDIAAILLNDTPEPANSNAHPGVP
jgi:hypothetical protein